MALYINKDKIALKLEKAIDEPAPQHDQQCPWEDGYYGGLYKAEGIIDTSEVVDVGLMMHTIIAECCDWLAKNTNLSHDKIEDCRNLMLTVKAEQFKYQKGSEV